MKNNDYSKCIISILNFLVFGDDEYNEEKNMMSTSNINMMKVLSKYGYDMISFTEHISDEKLWNDSSREFFSDDEKCLSFFVTKLNYYNKNYIG